MQPLQIADFQVNQAMELLRFLLAIVDVPVVLQPCLYESDHGDVQLLSVKNHEAHRLYRQS